MFQKLEELEKRYSELTDKLADPQVVGDNKQYQKLNKERIDLEELVVVFRAYREVSKNLAENRELLEEKDPGIREMAKAEIPELENRLHILEEKLKLLLLPKDPIDEKNVYLEIRAGTGGDEAALFAAELFRMYARYAESRHWRLNVIGSSATGIGGFKEIVAEITGDKVYSSLKYESGTHRVQRVPKTEAQGRVHTSAVTVAVMPEAEEIDVHIDMGVVRVDTYRASGAGGQHVNKTDSAVRMTHLPTGVVVACQDDRSQHKNRAKAFKLLQAKVYDMQEKERAAKEAASRKEQVGSGDRSEKIRTYNFPQNRLTDHRIGWTLYKLDQVMEGNLEETVTALRTYYQTEALKKQK